MQRLDITDRGFHNEFLFFDLKRNRKAPDGMVMNKIQMNVDESKRVFALFIERFINEGVSQ